jgi:hypothetical protein
MAIILDGTAGEQLSGNLTFTGTGNRITGDMTNSTQSNRVTFQTSTTNGLTGLEVIPNGTATISLMSFSNTNDATNAGLIQVYVDNAAAIINSNKRGTGTYLPLLFQTNNTTQMQIATDGTITGTKGNLQLISGTAVASTSGTSITFTGIPGWAKRITIMFSGVSTSGTSPIQVQIGSGSLTTTGYTGAASRGTTVTNNSSGFVVYNTVGANAIHSGNVVINTVGSNIWVESGIVSDSLSDAVQVGGGSLTLSGTLDRVAVTMVNGTDTFDAGSINIMYE